MRPRFWTGSFDYTARTFKKSKGKLTLRLLKACVTITGLNGVNAELAKNLVLTGVKVAVNDDRKITSEDLKYNFLFSEEHIGKSVLLAYLERRSMQ